MDVGIFTGGNVQLRAASASVAVVVGSLPPHPIELIFLLRGGFTAWSDSACSHIQPHALN